MNWREMVGSQVFEWSGPNRGIMFSVWWNVALFLLGAVAYPFDKRRILGLNPWIKPSKFEISTIIFMLTMAVLLGALGRLGEWQRLRPLLAWGFGIVMIVENTIIAMQSLRGVRSHMNYATAFDAAAFATMGLAIALNTVLVAVVLGLFLVTKTGLPLPVLCGACLGMAVLLAGSIEGVLMVARYGAHTVGAADGGAGLPYVNWSAQHGDLRVAHFFALHALQAFLLAGWGASLLRTRVELQTSAVVVFAVAYSVIVWILFAQAVAGRPFHAGT